jgi:hypothetical protein
MPLCRFLKMEMTAGNDRYLAAVINSPQSTARLQLALFTVAYAK